MTEKTSGPGGGASQVEVDDGSVVVLQELVHVERRRRTIVGLAMDMETAQLVKQVRSGDVWEHPLKDVGEVEDADHPHVHAELPFATVPLEVFPDMLAEMLDERFRRVVFSDSSAPLIVRRLNLFWIHGGFLSSLFSRN